MCGRYLITMAPEAMRRLFRYREQPNFPARYNVAPTQPIPIVRLHEGERQFALLRWGLIPAWVKDPRAFSLLINARADSVNDKPAFRCHESAKVPDPGRRLLRVERGGRTQAPLELNSPFPQRSLPRFCGCSKACIPAESRTEDDVPEKP